MEELRIPVSYLEWNPPKYFCRRAKKPFILDGNINKDFWSDAEFTEDFVDIEGASKSKPRYRTRVKMLWDDENLYFGAIMEGDEIWATLTERDCVIFYDNDFEIFIDPDSDTHQYFEFEMNALNTIWDLFLTKPYRDFGGRPLDGWDIHGLRTAVHIEGDLNNPNAENKYWSAEVVVPFKALKEMANGAKEPAVGDYYRLNFSRVHWDVDIANGEYIKKRNPDTGAVLPENNWVWAPTGLINIHYPEYWGFLFFTENGEEYEIPEIEKLKWELRKIYYLEQRHFDRHGEYANELSRLDIDLPISIFPDIKVAGRKFEISGVTSDGETRVYIYEDGRTELRTAEEEENILRRPSAYIKNSCTPKEYEYVRSLYRNMPLADISMCNDDFFINVVKRAVKTRSLVSWSSEITEELFVNFILPYRVNNENPVFYQEVFFNELYPIVRDMSLRDAVIAVNYWCMSKAVYTATNDRTGSPFTVINNAFGRCGEESTFAVSALRSVGIPARQVYVPRWSHCDDNHAWVEVYTGDGWHYLGACEPESRLDTGWFSLPASKAMLVHTRAFSDFAITEPIVKSERSRQEINTLKNYASTSILTVRVTNENGEPIEAARVDFGVVNYSEIFPLVALLTNKNGEASLLTGKGDLILHISKGGLYCHRHINVDKQPYVTIDFSTAVEKESELYSFHFYPPVGGITELPALSEVEIKKEKELFDENTALRAKRVAEFPTEKDEKELATKLNVETLDGILINSRGNHRQIEKFLLSCDENNLDLAIRLLSTLLQKDLADISSETLSGQLYYAKRLELEAKNDGIPMDIFDKYVLSPRIHIEFISAFYKDIYSNIPKYELELFRANPMRVIDWVRDHILLLKNMPLPVIEAIPSVTLTQKMGNDISRKILTVAIMRACAIPARLDIADSCISYYRNGEFVRIKDKEETNINSKLILVREDGSLREYYKNITIARLENGIYNTLDFSGLVWKNNKINCCIESGNYRIISTDRQTDDSLIAVVDFVEIGENENREYFLPSAVIEAEKKDVAIANRELEAINGKKLELEDLLSSKNGNAFCWIRTEAEPTEHLLNELIENAERYSALSEGITLAIKDESELSHRTLRAVMQKIKNINVVIDRSFKLDSIYNDFQIDNKNLPLIVVAENGKGRFAFSGYQVGIGEMILKCLNI